MNDIQDAPLLSVVIPCLNEEDTLGTCLRKINQTLKAHEITYEIIVADNGSTDASVAIAEQNHSRVVPVAERGYGNALQSGIEAAMGGWILMGDADDSYDFNDIPGFVAKMREGYDLVQGCRLPRGGGVILPQAMPWSHRWIGNPLFSFLCRTWFHAPINDVYCGMRSFTKELYYKLDLRCTGMEFATEMIIKASLHKAKISEVPITLHPDGRIKHPPHLRTLRDGWRTLRFFMLCSPRWLFWVPGFILILTGMILCGLAIPGVTIHRIVFDVHTLLFGCMAILCGYQGVLFAVMSKTFAVNEGILPPDVYLDKFYSVFNLEKGLVLGLVAFMGGLALFAWTVLEWRSANWGNLEYAYTMRRAIPAAFLVFSGLQTVMFSFFTSILGLKRR